MKHMKHYGDSSKHCVFFISNIFLGWFWESCPICPNKKTSVLKRLYRQFDLNKGLPKLASHHFPESHIFFQKTPLSPHVLATSSWPFVEVLCIDAGLRKRWWNLRVPQAAKLVSLTLGIIYNCVKSIGKTKKNLKIIYPPWNQLNRWFPIGISFSWGSFSGAMLVSGRVQWMSIGMSIWKRFFRISHFSLPNCFRFRGGLYIKASMDDRGVLVTARVDQVTDSKPE